MNLICKIRGHKWKNGYCARCGNEHEGHEWAPQPGICVEKCVICNMSKEVEHSFSPRGLCEFICTNCGKKILRHSFVPKSGCVSVCSRCGVEYVEHKWNQVKKNGETAVGCVCTLCGAVNPAGEHTPAVRRDQAGNNVLVCVKCNTVIRRLSPEEAAQLTQQPRANEE